MPYLKRLIFLFFFGLPIVKADPLTIAVASNFNTPMRAISKHFEANHPDTRIRLVFASSGKLYAQIINGAPYDIFLSADQIKPGKLIENSLAVADSKFTYALGQLALWSSSELSPTTLRENLNKGNFRHLAIANPKFAPYGQAAVETLKHLNLWQANKMKIVQGENIAQTFQFVRSANAELGFVSASQLSGLSKYWLVPTNFHQPIAQDAVLLSKSENNRDAISFMEFLRSQEAISIIMSFGYHDPVNKTGLKQEHK